jgi:glucose-6-phosphate 1-dehydrogenase
VVDDRCDVIIIGTGRHREGGLGRGRPTATEVGPRFRRPPTDVFGVGDIEFHDALRFRIRPDATTTLALAGKKPSRGRVPRLQELGFAERPGEDMRPYDRLIGAASYVLFAQEDTDAPAWRVVGPVLV